MKNLDLKRILTPSKKKPVEVPTPEIEHGSSIFILNPTPLELDLAQVQWRAYKATAGITGDVGFSAFIVAWALADADNNRLIDSGEDENQVSAEFLAAMAQLSGPEGIDNRAFKRLFDKAMQSFGFSKADVEELEKNSGATPSDDGSGSKPKPPASAGSRGSKASKTPKK